MDKQLQPWHIYTAIFVVFWALTAYFDNFLVTAVLCVAGGFGSDTFRRYLAGNLDEPTAPKVARSTDDAPTKPLPPEPEVEPETSQAEEVPIQ